MRRLLFDAGKQTSLLKTTMKNLNFSRKELSDYLKIPFKTFEKWLYEDRTIPKDIFEKLVDVCPEISYFKNYVNKELDQNWGRRKGGLIRLSQIKDIKSHMKILHDIKREKAKKVKHIKNISITSPFSSYVQEFSLDPSTFVGVMLLTDGYVYKSKTYCNASYASKNEELTKVFIELVKLWNKNMILGQYVSKNNVTSTYFGLPLQNDLLKISPSFKKSPSRKQTVAAYLKEPQPTLNFLKNKDNMSKILSMRLAFSTEGGITFRVLKYKNHIRIEPRLFLSCAHPKLCESWKELIYSLGLKMNIKKSRRNWSGIYGLYAHQTKYIKKFKELGGFLEGVKISKKGKYFIGVEKNKLLTLCLNKTRFKNLNELLTYGKKCPRS